MRGVLIFATTIAASSVSYAAVNSRPNVIIILTDDQGYGDLSVHGNEYIETPNMDQLHSESIRFTNFHVDPTSAPTRSALMTGKYSHGVGVWHTVRGGNHLRPSEVTMAEVFKHNGYNTALFGKWHLGANYPYRPIDRGFDEWLGAGDGGTNTSDCFFWNDRVNDMYWHNGEPTYREGFTPDVFFSSAKEYIKEKKESKDPFFIYLPTYVPHAPYTYPDPDFTKKYVDKGLSKYAAAIYASIEHLDGNVGDLRNFLKEQGLADNTILIFMTDNGGLNVGVNGAGMRGGKGRVEDGGHRVPCFIRYPNANWGEPRDIERLAAHIDLLPTFVDVLSLKLPKSIDFDGQTLTPLLMGDSDYLSDRTVVVESQRTEVPNPKLSAVMTQRWRLVGLESLYDISKDGEQLHDVADQYPEVVSELKAEFDRYWERVSVNDREFPTPIVGTKFDKEISLGISEQRKGKGWSFGHIAEGVVAEDVWYIDVAKSGVYNFEVRRWPRDAAAPFNGVPTVNKTVDAYFMNGPVNISLYASELVALPVSAVSLKVGDFSEKISLCDSDEVANFSVKLPKGVTTVDAAFYNSNGEEITKAYHVYITNK